MNTYIDSFTKGSFGSFCYSNRSLGCSALTKHSVVHDVDCPALAMVPVLSQLKALGMLVQLLLELIVLHIQVRFLDSSLLSLELASLLSKSSSSRLVVRNAELLSQ